MPVPDYQTLMLPVLKAFAEGAENVSQIVPKLKAELGLTDADAGEMIPSGRKTVLVDRAHWARTYLSKAGLLESPKRNRHQITARGIAVLKSNPAKIDNSTLAQFPEFATWFASDAAANTGLLGVGEAHQFTAETTPEEQIARAHAELDAALQAELMELVIGLHPVRFERLIIDLLNAMGYGAGELAKSMLTKASGDGGIDGIIHEDALGLDAVYIQAKRYAPGSNVGRPAIQQFVGSLTGEGATKGVFVTTSDFSGEARAYLGKVQHRIVLINGAELARLMIRHGVGVRPRSTYVIKGVDEDYFAEVSGL